MDFKEVIQQSKASIEKGDLEILLPLVAQIKPKHILEIGTWRGYSMEVWHKAFSPEKLATIEKDRDSISFLMERVSKGEFENLNPIPTLIGVSSHDESTLWNVKQIFRDGIDFLFIDGDHSYEGVKQDWEMYGPLVREGGIIAFHDALYHADKTEEVDLLWKELKYNHLNHKEIKSCVNSTGIGVIIK